MKTPNQNLNRVHELGGATNNVVLVMCEENQRQSIYDTFAAENPTVTTEMISTTDVSTPESYEQFRTDDKVFFVGCDDDYLRRFYLIKTEPRTTIVFMLNPTEQRQAFFERGEFMRYMTVYFTDPKAVEGN